MEALKIGVSVGGTNSSCPGHGGSVHGSPAASYASLVSACQPRRMLALTASGVDGLTAGLIDTEFAKPFISLHLPHPAMSTNPTPSRLAILLLAAGTLAACSDDNGTTPLGSNPSTSVTAAQVQRLLVADTAPRARLLAVHNDSTVASYTLAAPGSYVYSTASGRFAAIQQRTADRVNFYDAGVWVDGATGHRRAPMPLAFQLTDGLPTHATVTGSWISIFMDGNGRAVWMNEADFVAGAPRVAFEVQTGGPHHSGSSTIVINGTPYFVLAPRNPAGGLPTAVEVRNQAGQVVASVPNCPSMHGNAAILNGAAFGCSDGLVIVRQGVSGVTATKVTTTGDMAGLGLRNAWAAKSGTGLILGQFAALPGQPTRRVLALIDPVSGTVNPLPALPSGVVDHWRVIEPVKGQVVVFANNGSLYVYRLSTRQLVQTVANVTPALPTSGALTHQVDAVEDLAAVASPTTGEVVYVNLATGSIARRVNLGGAPSRLTFTGAKQSGTFTLAQ